MPFIGSQKHQKSAWTWLKFCAWKQGSFFMNIQPHFKELLKLLEENNVQHMIVGGYAVAFYGFPRFTKDLDIFYKLEEANISKLKKALESFGFPKSDLVDELFLEGNIIKIGIEPVRIDLLNDIDGVRFDDAAPSVVMGSYDDLETPFIGRADLIANKKTSARLQDLADVARLEVGHKND